MRPIFTALLVAAAIYSGAQQPAHHPENKAHIDVTGTAETEVVPDEIYIAIVIRERYEGREKISIESQEEKLKAAIRELGIDLDNLVLSDANADYVKVKFVKKDVLTKKDFVLKLTDAIQVGKVYEQLDKLQINDAYISKLNHSKIDEYRKETRKKAVKSAQEKAEYMLSALSPAQSIGKPLIVEEIPAGSNNYHYNYRVGGGIYSNVRSTDGSESGKNEEVSFKKITIKASVFARFEIKQ